MLCRYSMKRGARGKGCRPRPVTSPHWPLRDRHNGLSQKEQMRLRRYLPPHPPHPYALTPAAREVFGMDADNLTSPILQNMGTSNSSADAQEQTVTWAQKTSILYLWNWWKTTTKTYIEQPIANRRGVYLNDIIWAVGAQVEART